MTAAPQEVNTLREQGELGDTVVIGLGANGTGGVSDLQAAIDAIGPGKRIILVTCRVPRSWQDSVNRAVSTVAVRNRNVAIADWNKAVTGHETLLGDDGVHPGPEGRPALRRHHRNRPGGPSCRRPLGSVRFRREGCRHRVSRQACCSPSGASFSASSVGH
ncbi:hypothetical protein [Streptomyces sp. GS7]|uniref:hypothetical protein n=1 Tax=Streptomyces sp. GS7 TaxID=2692234 RepID=UPI001318E4EC|nr:hypothetical protein [Streptomyces sp. GS7]QHC23744.1 hypothetical protein GR130_22655 [Streptomyces sp. GS7]